MIQNEKNKFEGNLELQENQKWRKRNVLCLKSKKKFEIILWIKSIKNYDFAAYVI